MSWIGLLYYQNKVEQIGGRNTDHDTELNYKIKEYAKRGCQRIEIYHNNQTIYPAGIKQIKRG